MKLKRQSLQGLAWPFLVLLGSGLVPAQLFAAPVEPDSEVDFERALRSFPDASWYDEETGEFREPRLEEFHDNPLRTEAKPVAPESTTESDWWDLWPDWDFGGMPSFFTGLFNAIFYLLAVLLAIAIIGLLVWFFIREFAPGMRMVRNKGDEDEIKIDPKKVVDLPFEAKADMGNDPLAAVRRLIDSKSYDAAIIYLYGYMLLALDRQRHIYLHRGKTNRMYLRELKSYRAKQILETTILAFEDSFFGKHPLSEARFMEVWQQLDDFHACVRGTEGPLNPVPAVSGATA